MRFLSFLILILTSCSSKILTVVTEGVDKESLASYHVGTPDPLLENPPRGQKLLIYWSLPKLDEPTILHLAVRFGNREETVSDYFLRKPSGLLVFNLLGEDYCRLQGIATYRIEIFSEEDQIDVWQHPLWSELIQFDEMENTDGA